MITLLKSLYPKQYHKIYFQIQKLIEENKSDERLSPLSENDSMIITYGDSIIQKNEVPLDTLNNFLNKYIKDAVSAVHILPMFPYTSDDGFSVVDYLEINPDLGNWKNINNLASNYDLMFDAVINHISKSSKWFKEYAKGNPAYENYFIECDPSKDYSKVVRPRSLPLYYEYETTNGVRNLWATFSEDQLDINYSNPKVLIDILKILIEYAKNGAKYIRFDAIGFIWKKDDSSCIHLDEAHAIVKIMRNVLDQCAPNTRVISETNVPHEENISYFGNGNDEAHLIYQFSLPPLTLFTFLSEDATKLSKWADSLKNTDLSVNNSFFNFLASHDGIGMRPIEGILTIAEKEIMVSNTLKKGGRIGYKNNPDGSKSPYELNINYLSALCDDTMTILEKRNKFMAAQTILLSLQGIPGIYIHSLLGSENDIIGMQKSNINRRINREKINLINLESNLSDSNSLRAIILNEFIHLLNIRKCEPSFSPLADQEVLFLNKKVFSLLRTNQKAKTQILVLINISKKEITLFTEFSGRDLVSNKAISSEIKLNAHQYLIIKLH